MNKKHKSSAKFSESILRDRISIAAAQYSAVDSREYETVRLRRVFSGHQPMAALDAELLQSSVSAIHCHNDGTLNIQLKNGQVIGKE